MPAVPLTSSSTASHSEEVNVGADEVDSTGLRVVELDPLADPHWEAFVVAHPDALVYQHPLWLQVLAQVYKYTPVGLACVDATAQLRGILPLVSKKGLLTRRRLSSLPH